MLSPSQGEPEEMTSEQHLEVCVWAARADRPQWRGGVGGRLEVMERTAALGVQIFPK